MRRISSRWGFTIVELLIVIVVIAILITITVVAYNGVTRDARDKSLLSDIENVEAEVVRYGNKNGGVYGPAVQWYSGAGSTNPNIQFMPSPGNVIDIVATNSMYCIRAYNPAGNKNSITNAYSKGSTTDVCAALGPSVAAGGVIAIGDGAFMQTITSANCPTERTRAVDARDNHTYWVQKLADGKCWMLTNLAYAGGGINTYGDTKGLINGTGIGTTYLVPSYYIPASGANVTSEPTNPSASTNGTGQYGYLYNWCGAMGGQETAACANVTTPAPDTGVSVCPSGWRLPTGVATTGEFTLLNSTINGGLTNTDEDLRNNWLAQYSGSWSGGFYDQGGYGGYWSSSQSLGSVARYLRLTTNDVGPASNVNKVTGFAVRCIAS